MEVYDFYELLRALMLSLSIYAVFQVWGWLSERKKFLQALEQLPGPTLGPDPRYGYWTAHLQPFLDSVGSVPGYPHASLSYQIQQQFYQDYAKDGLFRLFLFHPYRVPFTRPMIFVFDIELVRQLLTDPRIETKIIKEPRIFSMAEAVVGGSFLALDNTPRWKHQRKLTARGMNQKLLERVHDITVQLLYEKVFPKWDAKIAASNTEESKNKATEEVVVWSTRISAEVLGWIAFSQSLGGLDDDNESESVSLFDIYQVLLGIIGKRIRTPSFLHPFLFQENREFQQASDKLNQFVTRVIQERMAQANTTTDNNKDKDRHQDLLSYMIEDDDERLKPTDQEIFANARMFLFAGQDTTSGTLAWAFYELARNPSIQERLQTELDDLFERKGNQQLAYKDIMALEYLDAIVKESLRLHAPAAVARRAIDDITLRKTIEGEGAEYTIPKGATIYLSPFMTGQGGGLGREFKPERFLKRGKVGVDDNAGLEQWVPFSMGSRDCVGKPMAIAELKLILAYVFYRYKVEKSTTHGGNEEPINIVSLTIKPHRMMLDFQRRK